MTGMAYSGIVGLDTYLVRLQRPSLVAEYGAAKTLASPLLLVSLAVMTIVQPETARASTERAHVLRRHMLLYGAGIGAIAVLACWTLSGIVVRIVYGTHYPEAAITLSWLGTGVTFLGLHTLLQVWCWGRDRYTPPLISLSIGAIIAIASNLLLVPDLGARGAGMAICLGTAVATAVLVGLSRAVSPHLSISDQLANVTHDQSPYLDAPRLSPLNKIISAQLPRRPRIESAQLIPLTASILTAIGLGYAIAQIGQISEWELLAVCLFIPPVAFLWRTSLTHPLVLFPLLYLGYFIVGSQNWVERSGHTSFRTFIDTNQFLRLPVVGLAAYMFGAFIVNYQSFLRSKVHSPAKAKSLITGIDLHNLLRHAGILLGLVGLVGAAAAVARHGVLVTNPEARSGGLGHVGVFAYALIPAAVLLAATAERRAYSIGLIAGTAVLLLTTVGFRVTVVILVLSYLVFLSMQGLMRLRGVLIGIGLILLLAFAVSTYRLDRSGEASVYGSEIVPTHVLAQVPSLTALYYQIPREGVAVLNSLVTLVPDDHPYMRGRLQAATYETAIPHSGKRIDSRGLVTQLVYGTSTVPTTLTPSILGGPYVDFGLIGVIVEMGLIGMSLTYLYQRSRRSGAIVSTLAYSYFLAVTIAGIHTGLLDIQLEFIVPLFTAIALWLSYVFPFNKEQIPLGARS